MRKRQGLQLGGQSRARAGVGGTRDVDSRAPADAHELLGGELSEALEELRVASETLQHQETLLDQAGAEVAAQMQRYRELFELAPDGYLLTRRDGVIEEANLAAARMLRVRQQEMIGKPLVVYVSAADRRRLLRLLREAGESGTRQSELLLRPQRGDAVPVSVHVATGELENPGPLRWLLHDVSARRDAEQRLEAALLREREATARLRELDDIKNAFLLAVSHDLRSPMTAIVMLARLLVGDTPLAPERRRRIVESMVANAARVERVQRNLVDLDRLARHAVALEPVDVDLAELVSRSLAAADAADRAVSARVEVAWARLDRAVVERVLDNLLSNAVNHTPEGTPIEVSVEGAGDAVVLTVADHGGGVPAARRRAIFEPFSPVTPDEEASPSRGVGVGLHLVARFAELHGGRAWVEQTPGGGASFRVLLREQE